MTTVDDISHLGPLGIVAMENSDVNVIHYEDA